MYTLPVDESPRILVVDDYKNIRLLLDRVLSRRGFEVTACADGYEALVKLGVEKPDLVLLDIMMPGIDGFEVLQRIRDDPETAELPVIFLTALGETGDLVRGLETGANDYISKPFEEAELIARINTQLKLKCLREQRECNIAQLRELDTLKDRFLLIASHDLRGPLGSIFTGLQLVDESIETDPPDLDQCRWVLDSMRLSARAMQSLITDLLDVQAIKAGRLELKTGPVSLNTLVETVIEQFAPQAARKQIQLSTELEPDLPLCLGDVARIGQALGNLIGNAVKYSPLGGQVVVRTCSVHESIRVEVQDSGQGITESDKPFLFEEFTQLSATPTAGEESAGVGLSITRNLIGLHGGRVGAESYPGQGSIFWFEIPA